MKNLNIYRKLFLNLHTNKQNGVCAPHKAVLLLSVIDLVESNIITNQDIFLSELLINTFKKNWRRYVGESSVFCMKIGTPFFHLRHEGFWILDPFLGTESIIESIKKSNPYSTKLLNKYFRCAQMDIDLFLLLQDANTRAHFRVLLIKNYL